MTTPNKALTTKSLTTANNTYNKGDTLLKDALAFAVSTEANQATLNIWLNDMITEQRKALAKACGFSSYTDLLACPDLLQISHLIEYTASKTDVKPTHAKLLRTCQSLSVLDESANKARSNTKVMLHKYFNREFSYKKALGLHTFEVKETKKEVEKSTKDDADYFQKIVELFQKIENKELYKTKLTQAILNESSEKVVEQKTTSKQKTQITTASSKTRYVNKAVSEAKKNDECVNEARTSAETTWELAQVA